MGSVVKFKRWAVIKRYPDRSEIAFMSDLYDQAKYIWLSLMTAPTLYSDDCFSIDLVKLEEVDKQM